MAISRVIEVSFGRSSVALVRVNTAYFYNNGIIFKPTDIELPTSYQVHWADSPQASSTLETIGTAEGAPIPDDLWDRSRVIYGWIYLHPTEDSGVTGYEVRIYKNVRAGMPDGTEPTPAEQSTIDQLISALNSAVEQTGEDVESASQSAQSAESAKTAAESARDTAGEYANDAESSAASASTSASQASASATASAQSASQSAQIKADVEDLVDDAQRYAESALIASQASVTARNTAQGYAQSASASAQSASTSASNASTSAQIASTKATEANTSAQTATQKASEAAQSASQALSYKTDAESAKTASQTAQGLAESARDTAVSAKTDAESARDDAVQAKEDAESAVASISGALAEKAPVITDTASGSIASFSDGADNLPLKSLVVNIDPVQDLHGQDAPYPAGGGKNKLRFPYAIGSGRTVNGVTATVSSDGIVTLNGTATAQAEFPLIATYNMDLPAGTYTLSGLPSGGSATTFIYNAYAFDENNTVLFDYRIPSSRTVTANNPIKRIHIYIRVSEGYTANNLVVKPQFEEGSSATSYAPYENICPISGWTQIDVNHSDADMTNPTTLTINLGQTVYGGKLDVLTGELTVYPYYASYNGETLTGEWISDRDKYVSGTTPTIGAQVVNIGAQGVTVQLEPHEVESLYGVNNLWADSGDTEVEYRADTKLFIERLTAPDSADMIADANITSGQYFMVGNSLYKATANIANGSAIIVGTNCTRKSLSEALNEINA